MQKFNIKKTQLDFIPKIENIFHCSDIFNGVTLFSSDKIEVVALNPYINVTDKKITKNSKTTSNKNPLKFIDKFIEENRDIDGRISFIGHISYDAKYMFEKDKLYKNKFENSIIPLINFTLFNEYIFFDYENKQCEIVSLFSNNINKIILELEKKLSLNLSKKSEYISTTNSRNSFENLVDEIIDEIKKGNVYQLNLSREIEAKTDYNAVELAINLYNSNKIEYGVFQKIENSYLISTSPELFFEIENRKIKTSPIKGTIEKSRKNAISELINSQKEISELAMIVDLLRNDISRICKINSVETSPNFPSIIELKNVYHAYCDIFGELKEEPSLYKIMKAMFPGGSISGCPKIKACQTIEKLENRKRGIYTGTFGYFNFEKKMVFNILIRTVLLHQNIVKFSVGGGITILSNPKDEFDETIFKGSNIWQSLNLRNVNGEMVE